MDSLGHRDERKAEKQLQAKEKELRMGFCPPESMRLSKFIEDCLRRSGDQVVESTKTEYRQAMEHFIRVVGDIDFQTVTHEHGERFRQACLDDGNKPTTVAKKLRELHAVFQLAVDRAQIDENPLAHVKPPKAAKNSVIRTYTEEQCDRLIREASAFQSQDILEFDIVITLALTSGMRKGEILNLVWSDIDFDQMTITVTPKESTDYTWEWKIKDHDKRTAHPGNG